MSTPNWTWRQVAGIALMAGATCWMATHAPAVAMVGVIVAGIVCWTRAMVGS